MENNVLEPYQSIVSIDRPCIKLENSPAQLDPHHPLAKTTTKLPVYNPYATYNRSPTMQMSQSTAGKGHRVVCAHASEPCGSDKSKNSGVGESVGFPATWCTSLVSPTYIASRPSSLGNPSPPTFLHTTATTIPLRHLNQSIA